MLVRDFAEMMGFTVATQEMAENDFQLEGCYIGDLLSNVMGNAKTGQVWLTVMTNVNVVAVAQLLDLSGIVLLEGNRFDGDALQRASLEGIPVFMTPDNAYDTAIRLHGTGLPGARAHQ